MLGLALAPTIDSVRRREFLKHLLWGGAVLAGSAVDAERLIAAASGHVDRRLVDDLHVVADDDARRMHADAPRDLLPHVERHLAYVQALLRSARSPAQEGRLQLIAGMLAAVAGKLSFNLGNQGDAHAYSVAAEGLAKEAGDGPLRARVLAQRSELYSDVWLGWRGNGSSTALQLLDQAHAVAGGSSSPWLRTWILASRAEEHAMRGDDRAARLDLEDADRLLGTAISADDGFFAHWYESPVARLAGYRGNCAQLLGASAEATTIIEESLAALPPSRVSVRCFETADLAMAYAKEEEVERACGLLTESLDLCSQGGLVAHLQRVVGVRRHLDRWRDTPAVRDLDDQLHHVTWAPV